MKRPSLTAYPSVMIGCLYGTVRSRTGMEVTPTMIVERSSLPSSRRCIVLYWAWAGTVVLRSHIGTDGLVFGPPTDIHKLAGLGHLFQGKRILQKYFRIDYL